jgi:hypothetical protein
MKPADAPLDGFSSMAELVTSLGRMPAGTLVPARELAAALETLVDASPEPPPTTVAESSWRERIWTVPAETRLGVLEVAEALGRPRSYVYERTGPKATDPLPHRKLDGTVVVTAGELRTWIRTHETVVHALPMDSTPGERRLRSVP